MKGISTKVKGLSPKDVVSQRRGARYRYSDMSSHYCIARRNLAVPTVDKTAYVRRN